MSIHISILGTCLMRDTFRVMDRAGKYKVDRFVQAVNPVAAVGESPLLCDVPDWSENYFDSKENNFNRRNAYLDLKKSVFDYIAEVKSDFLLIDIGDIRLDLFFFDEEKNKVATEFSVNRAGQIVQEQYLPPIQEKLSVLEIDKRFVMERLDAYLDRILELYPQEDIILFENYAVNEFYDREAGGVRHGWEDFAAKFNQAFDMVFPYCIEKLPRAHVIRFPKYMLGDEHHIWGRYPLHYIESLYRYTYEAVESIIDGKDKLVSNNKLSNLHNKWEKIFYREYSMLRWLDLARIDIKNHGDGNDVGITVLQGSRYDITMAPWFSDGGVGYVMETYDKYLELELECHGAGMLQLSLLGVDRRNQAGERIPFWIDYTRLAVNEKNIFWEQKSVWHDKSYSYTRQVSDGEKLRVEISLASHGYKGEELTNFLYI